MSAYHCASHGDGSALRQRMARCATCGWDGGATPITVRGEGRNVVKNYNGRSVAARRRQAGRGGGVIGTTASEYTRRISRSAERQGIARLGAASRVAAARADYLAAIEGF